MAQAERKSGISAGVERLPNIAKGCRRKTAARLTPMISRKSSRSCLRSASAEREWVRTVEKSRTTFNALKLLCSASVGSPAEDGREEADRLLRGRAAEAGGGWDGVVPIRSNKLLRRRPRTGYVST